MKNAMKALGVLGLGSLLIAAAPAWAEPTLEYSSDNYGDFSLDPFGGFDLTDQGSAITPTFVFDGATPFTTYFMSAANEINQLGGGTFTVDGLQFGSTDLTPPGYEFTVYAEVQETAECVVFGGPTGCTTAAFTAVGGIFEIYFQSTANADLTTGTGIRDGDLIISGTIQPGFAGTFSNFLLGESLAGSGVFNFFASVDFTNNDYINPNLASALAITTLQFGGTTTSAWTEPTAFVDAGFNSFADGTTIFQADGNIDFNAVPEPHAVALLGLGLLAIGAVYRRRLSRMG